MSVRSRRSRLALVAGVATALGALVLGGTPALASAPDARNASVPRSAFAPGRYVVTLTAKPIATYAGGVSGLPATKPARGKKVEVASPSAQAYQAYLTKQQSDIGARVGAKPTQRYSVALNGFSATLTAKQARDLSLTPGVLAVTKDALHKVTTDERSTDFLRLSGPTGIWAGLGGVGKAGNGIVVGVIDTGIWPESASVAGPAMKGKAPSASDPFLPYRKGATTVMKKADGNTFTGICQTGQKFRPSDCNTKVIAARYFANAWLAAVPPADRRDTISPRDGEGHGTHTSSTAAGNYGVAASVDGIDFGQISGVAPAARISVYKALWTGATVAETGGFTSDIVSAVDAAVSDGVDVINYSVGSGSESPADDPIALAYFSAASAGIFVSASAGNSGPGASTLDNTSPWVTTVAASTVGPYEGTVNLGNGGKYAGISTSITSTVGPAPLVKAVSVKLASSTDAAATICTLGTLDPAKVAGKIVVCDRGVVDRVEKSAEVKRAGGVGMVLANLTDNSTDGDVHSVPTVHLNIPSSLTVRAYAGTAGATATLTKGNQSGVSTPYPQVAGFSSRGPSKVNGGDIIKPDIAAPGVSILAAVAPLLNSRKFDFLSGTSMAAPHIAGLAALYLGAHPQWSPMDVKSALMTTATDTKTASGAVNTDPFAQGAGEVTPSKMLNPGLVYDSSDVNWVAYLEGLGVDTGTGVAAVDPSDLNSPSIAIGQLLGSQTVTRKVTAVSAGLYRATVSVPGLKVTVSPSVLHFDFAGQTKSFKVTFSRTSAAYDTAAKGFLTWTGARTTVRSPIAVVPKQLSAPAAVTGSGASGAISFTVTPGVSGAFPITAYGLNEGTATTSTISAGGSTEYPVTVPAGTKVAQFTTRSTSTLADIDLEVYQGTPSGFVLVGSSAGSSPNETVLLDHPAAGPYIALVVGFADAPGTTSTPYTFRSASVVPGSGVVGFTVTPTNPTAVAGTPITVNATWSGLSATTTYLGFVEYLDGSGTIVTVN